MKDKKIKEKDQPKENPYSITDSAEVPKKHLNINYDVIHINNKEQRDNNIIQNIPIEPEKGIGNDYIELTDTNNQITIFNYRKIKEILLLVLPTLLFFLSIFLLQTINFSFVGHYTKDTTQKQNTLDAIGITHIYVNCSIISIIQGLISGLDTLGSNAFGANKYKLLGYYFQRSQIICYSLLLVFLIFHYFFAIKILIWLNVKDGIVFYIKKYLPLCLLFAFFDIQFSFNFRYINIIEKSHYNLIFLLITLLFHPLWCYLFINVCDLGIEGAALSLTLSQFLNCCMGTIYIYIIKPLPQSIFMFNKYSFRGWKSYLAISIPSAFLLCTEWWAFEIIAIIAATLSQDNFTVHIFATNFIYNFYTISFGFGFCISILVGREFGKGDVKSTRQYFILCYLFGVCIILISSLGIFFLRDAIFNLLVDDKTLIEKAREVLLLISILLIFDFSQFFLCSFLKGLGKQWIATIITIIVCYGIEITLAVIFSKVLDLGVFGIWLGIAIGVVISTILYFLVYLRLDYNKILIETQNRLELDHKISIEDEALEEERLD